MHDYLIEFNDYKSKSLEDFINIINQTKGIPLKDLKVKDLSYFNDVPIFPGTGIYLFREGSSVRYVGKVSSMSFIERIPKHFDLRRWAWFNTLLKRIVEKSNYAPLTNEKLYLEPSQLAFEKYNLVLIHMDDKEKHYIVKFESALRGCLNPLNKYKRKKLKNLSRLISDYWKY